MQLSACICDDNPADLERYAALVKSLGQAHGLTIRLQRFSDGMALYDAMECGCYNPDIIFLDILMDGLDGVQTGLMLRKLSCSSILVFLTTTPSFALPAFDVEAFAYIVKGDHAIDKLDSVLVRAAEKLRQRPRGVYRYVTKQTTQLIPFRDIRYITAQGHNIEIYCDHQNTPIRQSGRIGVLEKELCLENGCFIRIHRSFLVNIFRIRALYPQKLLTMDGDTLPVGGKYISAVRRWMLNYRLGPEMTPTARKSEA